MIEYEKLLNNIKVGVVCEKNEREKYKKEKRAELFI